MTGPREIISARELVLIAAVVMAVIFVFSGMLANDFVYDDWFTIQSNIAIRKTLNPSYYFTNVIGPRWSFVGSDADTYRPMEYVVFALIYKFFGLDPFNFHLVSLVAHALNSSLFFIILLLLFKNRIFAFFGALFFGLHPIAVESVAWATQQGGVLAMFFLLLALLALIFYEDDEDIRKKSIFYPIVLFCLSSLAVFLKEHAVVLPFFYILIIFFKNQPAAYLSRIKSKLPEIIIISIPAVAALILRSVFLPSFSQQGPWGGGRFNMLLTIVTVFKYYIGLLFWPNPLSVNYDGYPIFSKIFDAEVLVSVFLLSFIIVGAFALRKAIPRFSLGVFWFFAALLPVSNVIFPMKQILNERFLYFAAPGFVVAVLGLVFFVYEMFGSRGRKFFLAFFLTAASIWIIAFALFTGHRIKDWQNDMDLWGHELSVSGDTRRTHNNYAISLELEGEPDIALEHYRKSLELASSPETVNSSKKALADALTRADKPEEAIRLVTSHPKDFPEDQKLKFALAWAFFNNKDFSVAGKYFREIVKSGKYDMTALIYMLVSDTLNGVSREQVQKDIDAISVASLRNAMPHLIDAKVNMLKKNWGAALKALDLLREERELPLVEQYLWRAQVLEKLERFEEARDSYDTVLLFYPRSVDSVRGLKRIENKNL